MRKIIYGMIGIMLFASGNASASDIELMDIIKLYQSNLPRIETSSDGGSKAKSVVEFLGKFRAPQYRCKLPEEDELCRHIQQLMEMNQPLILTLPSFPVKSKNTEKKVISEDPDLGEVVGLLTMGHLCQQIGSIYEPGAQVILQGDGFYAVEALGLPDIETRTYVDKIRLLICHFKLEDRVTILSPDELPDDRVKGKSFDELRALLDREMIVEVSKDALDSRSTFCAKELDCAYYRSHLKAEALEKVKKTRCYALDLKEAHDSLSRLSYDEVMRLPATTEQQALLKFQRSCEQHYNGSIKPFAKRLTQCIVQRAPQFRKLLDQIYPPGKVIRLKIHMDDKPVMSQRLPILLVYNQDEVPGTPWHHTPVVRRIGNSGIQIYMMQRSPDFQTIKEASLPELPFPIRWTE